MYITLIVIYSLLAISLVISLLLNGVRPSKTLAWLLAIFTIPVGGILLYLMLGRNRRIHRLSDLKEHELIKAYLETQTNINWKKIYPKNSKHFRGLSHLIRKNSGNPPTSGNHLIILEDGKSTFEAIFKTIENASKYIYVQYYIFEDGDLAQHLFELFEKKIKEGVQVKIIYDGIGSFSLSKKYIRSLKAIGVEVYPFLPFKLGRFLSSLNYRNHRKIIVIDGEIAFTGGINIADKYIKGDAELGIWRDMHVQITGPAAKQLESVFLIDLFLASGEKKVLETASTVKEKDFGSKIVQIAPGGPDDYFSTIGQTYFYMISNAKEYIYITNPYVIPGSPLLEALQVAASSGVDVRLLISEKVDSNLVKWTVRSYFESLLKAGVKIYLFPDGFLHSKTIVLDDEIVSIGTANLDIRSFEQNYEVNAIIYDTDFAVHLKAYFLNDCKKSKTVDYAVHKNRPFRDKLKEGVAKIFSPVL